MREAESLWKWLASAAQISAFASWTKAPGRRFPCPKSAADLNRP